MLLHYREVGYLALSDDFSNPLDSVQAKSTTTDCCVAVPYCSARVGKKKFQVLLVEMVNFLGIGVGFGGKSPQGEERKGGRKEEGTIQSDWNGPPLNS